MTLPSAPAGAPVAVHQQALSAAHRQRHRSRQRSAPGALPAGWPRTLALGMVDPPGDAAALAASGGFSVRYQYLSGGVGTAKGWQTWDPSGTFVDGYINESLANGQLPVFSYYMLLQSTPSSVAGGERARDMRDLRSRATMIAYFRDIETFLRHAGAFAPRRVVLHFEPDLWGYIQQSASGDDPGSVPAQVSATGLAELHGLANNASGLAQAIVRLRDRLAPNVLLAYHLSLFGTGKDLLYSKPTAVEIDELAGRSARFYRLLHAPFDVIFGELSNRDAGYSQTVLKDGGASWWTPQDYEQELRYLGDVVRLTARRVVLWQIPLGNTRMRAMNNTQFHYQDNHVQWLLDYPSGRHLRAYAHAGVIGLLFGAALPGDTCACDAAKDGATNPPPIDGNTAVSQSSDDDGGYLRARARQYARAGGLPLP